MAVSNGVSAYFHGTNTSWKSRVVSLGYNCGNKWPIHVLKLVAYEKQNESPKYGVLSLHVSSIQTLCHGLVVQQFDCVLLFCQFFFLFRLNRSGFNNSRTDQAVSTKKFV